MPRSGDLDLSHRVAAVTAAAVATCDKDDCISPHIDHHNFLRPFCTVSFLAECSIFFGRDLKVLGPGEFVGAASISLPLGSILVLKGNGADVAKHCIPAVPAKRISITFRKMDASMVPFQFKPDPELQKLAPVPYAVRPVMASAPHTQTQQNRGAGEQIRSELNQQQQEQAWEGKAQNQAAVRAGQSPGGVPFSLSNDEFPALGASPASGRRGRR